MIDATNLSGQLAFDANSLNKLKTSAKDNSPEAIKEVAKQFEAVFINMVMKSMRAASPQDGIFDNEQSRTFTAMLDQQLSSNLASKGVGLADILTRQLTKVSNTTTQAMEQAVSDDSGNNAKQFEAVFINMVMKSMRAASPQDGIFDNEQSRTFTAILDQQLSSDLASKGVGLADILTRQLTKVSNTKTQAMEQAVSDDSGNNAKPMELNRYIPGLLKDAGYVSTPAVAPASINKGLHKPDDLNGQAAAFHQRLSRDAIAASRATGMPANYMLGQAALETGWGRREIKGSDGTNSHNLFGIKATGGWKGKVVETTTTEYINGVKQKRVEKFRAYDSYAESFKDFANLIQNNPRYKQVMDNVDSIRGYARALQNAGYATDPNYANKLASVIKKVTA